MLPEGTRPTFRPGRIGVVALGAFLLCDLGAGDSDIATTKHNLAVSGTGAVRALNETRICVFCHTPHNAAPLSPLWNRQIEPKVYTVYTSPTLRAGPLPQPSGPTKLCLTCHDGTIATGAVINPRGGIAMTGGGLLPPGGLTNFGQDLSGHHPVAFPYGSALPNLELVTPPPDDLLYGGTDEVHCMTCHDPHDDQFGMFLAKDNRFSALCTRCHQMTGWTGSAHATSTAPVTGVLPVPPRTWPTYKRLDEWGCEACHTPHFAPTAEQLLVFPVAPPNPDCTTMGCHTAGPPFHTSAVAATHPGGTVDIARQTQKLSAHHGTSGARSPTARVPGTATTNVACVDCHNPHRTTKWTAEAPYVSGPLQGVSGVDRDGIPVEEARFEYEICLKCHGDNSPDLDLVPRVISVTNTRLAFDPANPSYHPVIGVGRNTNTPSIPSPLRPDLRAGDRMYCSDCHADDAGGSRGPHGSAYAPILRERYETLDQTPESYESYALCYRCHDRTSILGDAGFPRSLSRKTASGGGHSGHLASGAPCSACHDPHGVAVGASTAPDGTGSHTRLINFDTRIVLPRAGAAYPVFTRRGPLSGRCNLVCHGVDHDNTSYP